MANITIEMKDGTKLEFKHEGRSGGSYTKELKLENGFAVVMDEWGKKTIIPSADIKIITTNPIRW